MQRAELTLIVLAAVIAVVMTGCGGGSGSSATGEISVSVMFPEQSQAAGPTPQELPQATNSVRIQVVPPAGSSEPVVPDLVIRRDPDSSRIGATVRGVPPGDYVVRALAYVSFDGTGPVIAEAMAPVTVMAGRTSTVHLLTDTLTVLVEVLPPVLELPVYEQAPLAAICYSADGNVAPGDIEWSSNDPTVAAVSADGMVTGLSAGNCLITATDLISGVQGSCEVATESLVVLVEVLPPVLVVAVQEQAPLMAICYDSDGNVVPGDIEWSSDDPTVETVSGDGVVEGLAAGGFCFITATDLISGVQGNCEVTVVR